MTDEKELKKQYAMELLRNPTDPYKAALALFPNSPQKALAIFTNWREDPEIDELKKELVETFGDIGVLPTKAQVALKIYEVATDNPRATVDEKLKAYKLYADVMGYIERIPQAVINNNLTQNKVLVVKDHGTDDQWSRTIAAQQAKLVSDAVADTTDTRH